jgi:hypothetical protein
VICIGIDPGAEGGIARLVDRSAAECPRVGVGPLPMLAREPDASAIADLLRNERDMASHPELLHVWAERPQAMPASMGGGSANFRRGLWWGLLVGLCAGLRLRLHPVRPAVWQRTMLAGTEGADTGVRSILAAQRLFPGIDLRRSMRCKGPSDGLSDALLIAEYGRRQLEGPR